MPGTSRKRTPGPGSIIGVDLVNCSPGTMLPITKNMINEASTNAISVEEAKQLIIENTNILEPTWILSTEAKGYVLAEDVVSTVNLPLFTNSAVDGYAVKSIDVKDASENSPTFLKLTRTVRAGDFPDFIVHDREAAKIMTGVLRKYSI